MSIPPQKANNSRLVRFTERHPTISGYGFILAALGVLVVLWETSPYFRYYYNCAFTPCLVPILGPLEILEIAVLVLVAIVLFGLGFAFLKESM
jgi:hypothetical protein